MHRVQPCVRVRTLARTRRPALTAALGGMLPPPLAATVFVAGAAAAAAPQPAARQVLSLDGAGWTLQLDPSDPTVQKMVQDNCSACTGCTSCTTLKVGGPVSVPGAWAAQGFGQETAALKTQYFGLATYSRLVAVPAAFRAAGRTVWLVVERPQRSVSVKANGKFVGNHTGYLGKFEGEVTQNIDLVADGGSLNLSLGVDAKQGPTDGLVGCSDFGPDGIPVRGWGGIGGHVRLESRSKAWIVDPHIQHGVPASLDSATINASITIGGSSGGGSGLSLRATYAIAATNTTVGQVHASCSSANVCNVPNIAVNAPQLWSPRSPVLHTALLQLVDSTGTIYDSVTLRFGLKRFEIVGIHWKLNGEWLYLHGYGDDSIYPMSIAPPLNFSFYLERLKIAKGLGFNYVRHHTNVLPDEYFAAACEVGIMVQAEFPMFGGRDGCSGATFACQKNAVYFEEWNATILRLRNHPCVFDYTMNNEGPLENHKFAMTLYNMAKELDPSRLVSTSDGISDDGNANHSASQGNTSADNPFDFLTPGYEGGAMPLDNPGLFRPGNVSALPYPQGFRYFGQPLVNHETGNIGAFPDVEVQIPRWAHGPMKPWWLTSVRDSLASRGLLGSNASYAEDTGAIWAARSARMYMFAWKDRMEAMRKTKELSGYEWWLLQDFWTTSNGILDSYFQPKYTNTTMASLSRLNDGIQLLVAQEGDNLPDLAIDAPRLLRNYPDAHPSMYWKGEAVVSTSLWISNYGAHNLSSGAAELTWSLGGVAHNGTKVDVCNGSLVLNVTIPQGPEGLMPLLPSLTCPLPDLGHSPPPCASHYPADCSQAPWNATCVWNATAQKCTIRARTAPPPLKRPRAALMLTLRAALRATGATAAAVPPLASNEWQTRVFPNWQKEEEEHLWIQKKVWTTEALCPYIHYPMNLQCRMPTTPVGPDHVIILDQLTSAGLEWAAQGATLLVFSSGDGSLDPVETLPSNYHPSWWTGNPTSTTMGTVVYPGFDAIVCIRHTPALACRAKTPYFGLVMWSKFRLINEFFPCMPT
eukprot:SAG31_NODE_35_length_31836_cov_10.841352_4_plen_1036_part_00